MSDYAVKVTIRNGRILARIRAAGFQSVAKFAKKHGLPYTSLMQLLGMRRAPMWRGDWLPIVYDVSSALHCEPEEMFTDLQRTAALKKNSFETSMSEHEFVALASEATPERQVEQTQMQRLLHDGMKKLTEREAKVVALRFGLNGDPPKTCAEIAKITDTEISTGAGNYRGLSGVRIQQIEAKALRKLRHGNAPVMDAAIVAGSDPVKIAKFRKPWNPAMRGWP